MSTDAELLQQFVSERSDAAFAELVSRHVNLVYRTAQRQLAEEANLAQDVTQAVFTQLATKARRLSRDVVVAGWLYNTTRYTVANVVRAERRRRRREQEALMNNATSTSRDQEWMRLKPVLDDVMGNLSERDRHAILLRYFEDRPFAEMGSVLHVSEDAARMRVDRALERLRFLLRERGIASTAEALAGLFATQVAGAAPSGQASAVAQAALSAGAGKVSLLTFLIMNKTFVGVIGVVIAAGILTTFSEVRSNHALRTKQKELESDNHMLNELRSENQRLAAETSRAAPPSLEAAELARLREDVARAKARVAAAPAVAGPVRPAASWTNAGVATPSAAFETLLWARAQGDDAVASNSINIQPESRAKLDAFFARLPEDARKQRGSPEKLLFKLVLGETDPITSFQIIGQSEDPSRTLLQVKVTRISGKEGNINLPFERVDEGWRAWLTGPAEKTVMFADPTTGLPPVKK